MFLTCLCWPRRPTKRLKSWMISPGYFVALMSPACCLSSIIMRDGRASILSWVRTTDVSPERVKTWAGQGSMKQHPQPQLNSPPFSYPGLPAPEGRTLLYFILFNSHLWKVTDETFLGMSHLVLVAKCHQPATGKKPESQKQGVTTTAVDLFEKY